MIDIEDWLRPYIAHPVAFAFLTGLLLGHLIEFVNNRIARWSRKGKRR